MTTSTTRRITVYSRDSVRIDGLTKGPAAGWSWDGPALTHPAGIRLTLTEGAAERVAATVNACVPPKTESLTGYQMGQLPTDQRDGFELNSDGWGEDEHDNEHVGRWVRTTPGVFPSCDIDTSEVVGMANMRKASNGR